MVFCQSITREREGEREREREREREIERGNKRVNKRRQRWLRDRERVGSQPSRPSAIRN